jgi:hypothetical protein
MTFIASAMHKFEDGSTIQVYAESVDFSHVTWWWRVCGEGSVIVQTGVDLRTPSKDAQDALTTLVDFLTNDAEAYAHHHGYGYMTDNGDPEYTTSDDTARWSYEHRNELEELRPYDEDEEQYLVTVGQEAGHAGGWTARCTCGWSTYRHSARIAQNAARLHGDQEGHDASGA